MEEKLSSWKHDKRSEKLPSLLSLKSNDSLVSLELSLMLEGPDARESSAAQLSTVGDQESRETPIEKPGKVKLEHLEECLQTFLGPNQHMGPFPSTFAKVKEEPVATSFWWNQLPGVCTMESSAFPNSISGGRERGEASGKISLDELKVRDFLGVSYNMEPVSSTAIKIKAEPMQDPMQEPMPSSLDQSKVSCTLEKIQIALQRSQFNCKVVSSSIPTQTATQISGSGAFPTWRMLTNLPFTHPGRTPLKKLPPRPLSPTTSDASSAASSKSSRQSKSSRHSSTSPSVMSFQGEERDDLGAHASSSDASLSSQVLHSSITQEAQGEASSVLVAVGCTTCLMFVMLSKDNPTCPKCGSTGLLEIRPTSSSSPRKRQKMESSNLNKEGRRSWDACDL